MEKLLHDIPSAQAMLSMGRTRVYEEIRAGKIVAIKSGDRTLIPHTSLVEYVDKKIVEAKQAGEAA